ncbi:MAG: nuclear transport factor 2 family protein [Planctomycetota bacterium]
MTHHESIRAMYQAFRDRKRAALEALLAPDYTFASPFGNFVGRDAMLDVIWPQYLAEENPRWATDIEIFGTGPGYMVRYRHESDDPSKSGARLAEFVRFEGDLVVSVEVYLGTGAIPLPPPPTA